MPESSSEKAPKAAVQPRCPAEILGNARAMGALLGSDDEQGWLSTVPKDPSHHKYVVWLGCHVLRTPQLAETLQDIFRHFAIDHVSLGGPTSCCGVTHDRAGDKAIGDRLTRQTVKKFDAFTPEQMLYWCPSCDNHLREKGEAFETVTTKQRKSVVRFLAEFLTPDKLNLEVPLRVAVHTHSGTPEQDADGNALRQILSRIPKLEIVSIPDVPVMGRHCNDAAILKVGKERYRAEMCDWIARSRREGVNRLISLYHSCHRQLNQLQMGDSPEAKIGVDNYLTLIARALGLPSRDDNFSRFAEIGDVDKILDDLSGKLQKTRLNRELARRALAADFASDRGRG